MVDEDFLPASRNYEHLLVVDGWNLSSVYELHDFLADLLRLVFLDDMTTVSDHVHLVLALHMSNSQLCVHALRSR